ncbi:hypothetical protein WS79_01220 [Burkholderia territorii]|nr:hypothetical protein WS79_01220 [Burkholderia territorii]
MRYDNGKSADAISGLLKKGVLKNIGTVENFDDLVRRAGLPAGKVVIYEDGLFSGTEWVGIFMSLMGAGKSEKCDKLHDPSVLVNMDLEVHFAVATTVGVAFLRRALAKLGLDRVQLTYSSNLIEVLSPLGQSRLAEETLFSDDGKVEADSVLPRVFQTTVWGTRAADATQYCEAIGRDLWASYWKRKDKPVSADMLDRVALGASNLGFAMAFPFSLPKVTLPLFWCAGEVTGHKKKISWEPLFPNAA